MGLTAIDARTGSKTKRMFFDARLGGACGGWKAASQPGMAALREQSYGPEACFTKSGLPNSRCSLMEEIHTGPRCWL